MPTPELPMERARVDDRHRTSRTAELRRQGHPGPRGPRSGPQAARACTSAPPVWPGLHHLIWEVVDNAVDEAMAGYCTRIDVTLLADGGCRVDDNGRGIPVDPYPSGPHKGKSAAEVVLTVLHAGGKFGGERLQGVRRPARRRRQSSSTRCRERLILEVDRDGKHYRQEYAKGGKPQGKMDVVGATPGARPHARAPPSRSGRTRRSSSPRAPSSSPAPCSSGCRPWRSSTRASRSSSRDERAEQRADGHVPVQGRHRRLRQAPQRLEGAAVLQGLPLRGRRRRRPDPRHRHAVEHRLLRGHPRLRQRHLHHRGRHARRGLQDRAHHRASTSTPGPRTCSRRRTRTSSARTSARASPRSSR